jgi:hypothetical protein
MMAPTNVNGLRLRALRQKLSDDRFPGILGMYAFAGGSVSLRHQVDRG